ncbi:type I-E CRISPR-associated protein Cse2/CasB [Roseospirillum parvum]|uniref:CRISPR type I-E/ECOLI-associated protein CasB/Cse2 n=1 Tax=Roseospirillum parvum TaxID=83401 RepID=A0A1G8EDT8_9PROT|nr:type I-E CRISPR-associated protein Cse2/CasB [Roseospirillum parvum]SDH68021.1 CRISPR type I-E/ECOLI-associated protein CasB/Cse2 [Roseospirillum parvum]
MTDPKPDSGAVALDWWRDLRDNRAAAARLRRCHSPLEALLVPQTLTLARRLNRADRPDRLGRVGALAVTLAHVKEHAPGLSVMRAVGATSTKDDDVEGATLSEQRLRRLLLTDGDDESELMSAFVRLVRLMKGTANVADLAHSLLFWSDHTRQRWVFDYYNAGRARPDADPTADLPSASGDSP